MDGFEVPPMPVRRTLFRLEWFSADIIRRISRKVPTDSSVVRISLSYARRPASSVTMECPSGGFAFGNYGRGGRFAETLRAGAGQILLSASGSRVEVSDPVSGETLFRSGFRSGLAVEPGGDEAVRLLGRPYRGGFRVRARRGALDIVNFVPFADYVKGVVASEMHGRWPVEAVKAQAVCSRTFAAYRLHTHWMRGFDLCSMTHCHTYTGMGGITERTDRAVEDTCGEFLSIRGRIAAAMYSSCNGGACEDPWTLLGFRFPHFRVGPDPHDSSAARIVRDYDWSRSLSGDELGVMFSRRSLFRRYGRIVSVAVDRTETGGAKRVTFRDEAGRSRVLRKGRCKVWLELPSQHFGLGSSDGGIFRFDGSGYGHNVGMSQYGACRMAMGGTGYKDILKFYFPGAGVSRLPEDGGHP